MWCYYYILLLDITSLFLHYGSLFPFYDVVLVQETRLTSFGQQRLNVLLHEHNWAAIWGAPCPPQRANSSTDFFSRKCGGVAVLYRNSLPFQQAPPYLVRSFPHLTSDRFLHTILSNESGVPAHFIAVYGFTGANTYILQLHRMVK